MIDYKNHRYTLPHRRENEIWNVIKQGCLLVPLAYLFTVIVFCL